MLYRFLFGGLYFALARTACDRTAASSPTLPNKMFTATWVNAKMVDLFLSTTSQVRVGISVYSAVLCINFLMHNTACLNSEIGTHSRGLWAVRMSPGPKTMISFAIVANTFASEPKGIEMDCLPVRCSMVLTSSDFGAVSKPAC